MLRSRGAGRDSTPMPVGRSNEIEADLTRGSDWQSWDVDALIGRSDDGSASSTFVPRLTENRSSRLADRE